MEQDKQANNSNVCCVCSCVGGGGRSKSDASCNELLHNFVAATVDALHASVHVCAAHWILPDKNKPHTRDVRQWGHLQPCKTCKRSQCPAFLNSPHVPVAAMELHAGIRHARLKLRCVILDHGCHLRVQAALLCSNQVMRARSGSNEGFESVQV